MKKLRNPFAASKWLMFPLILFVLSIALQARGTFGPLNNWITDFRTEQVSVPATGEIAILAIDPESLQHVGTWPWSRKVHGDILDRLVDLNAGIVMYDVDFAFPSDADGDAAFANALDRAGGATLLATFLQTGSDGNIVYNQPHTPFYTRSWPAVVGVSPSDNGQIRTYPTGANIDGLFVPSAGVQIAGSYASEDATFLINFGIQPETVPVFSVSDLLTGRLTQADIAGRSILIGAMAAELGDQFAVPLHQVVPGVVIHALAAETLLQGVAITPVPSIWLLPALLILLCALHHAGRQNAWRLVSFAFLTSIGVEIAGGLIFWWNFSNISTAMFHPAFIMLAIGRLATSVDFSRILIQRQEVQMENSERLRQHIFENSSDGFLAVNAKGQVMFQSDAATALLGTGELPSAIRQTAARVIDQKSPQPWFDQLDIETATETKSLELLANESQLQSLDGKLNLSTEPLALITLRDVTDLKRKQRQIEYLSRHDDKTSALRRHSFCELIEGHIADRGNIAVAAIALRRLSAINATLGRDTGDKIITKAVRRLQDPSMKLGPVARLEGNVLGVVIPQPPNGPTSELECQRILDVLAQPYNLSGSQIQIGVSLGFVAVDDTLDQRGEDYLSCAQDALAHAKRSIANTYSAYDSAFSAKRKRSRGLEHALNHALQRDEFHLLYQPQYRLSDQSLIGAEALVRWESAEFGFVSPAEFIPIAESSGFIMDLGHFVLERSIQAAAGLPSHLVMSANVSVFQLLSADFPDQVAALLHRYDLSPDQLCLELTESEFLSPDSEAVDRMRALKSLGVSWALDDFGTGYSSLGYLKDLPFEKVKLDRAFLKDVAEDQKAQTGLRSLLGLVKGYGKSVLCEGAETQDEVDILTQFGCDSVQGYYFGRPEPFEELQTRALLETDQPASHIRQAKRA